VRLQSLKWIYRLHLNKDSVPTSQRTVCLTYNDQPADATGGGTAVCCDYRTKHTNTLCAKMQSFWITVHTGIDELSTIRAFLRRDCKMRKATIRFVMYVLLSAWTNSTPTRRIFMNLHNPAFFENLFRKFQLH